MSYSRICIRKWIFYCCKNVKKLHCYVRCRSCLEQVLKPKVSGADQFHFQWLSLKNEFCCAANHKLLFDLTKHIFLISCAVEGFCCSLWWCCGGWYWRMVLWCNKFCSMSAKSNVNFSPVKICLYFVYLVYSCS